MKAAIRAAAALGVLTAVSVVALRLLSRWEAAERAEAGDDWPGRRDMINRQTRSAVASAKARLQRRGDLVPPSTLDEGAPTEVDITIEQDAATPTGPG